ncbi:MAG: hypothetical protein ABIH23_07970 [bacterium]
MTKHEIAALSCRIFAVAAVVHALSFPLLWLIEVFIQRTPPQLAYVFICWLHFALFLVAALLLWILADRIAARMISDLERPNTDSKILIEDLQRIGFSIVGLFILGQSIPHFVSFLSRFALRHSSTHAIADAVTFTLQVAIGLGFFFGSHRLVELLKAVRRESSADRVKKENIK